MMTKDEILAIKFAEKLIKRLRKEGAYEQADKLVAALKKDSERLKKDV